MWLNITPLVSAPLGENLIIAASPIAIYLLVTRLELAYLNELDLVIIGFCCRECLVRCLALNHPTGECPRRRQLRPAAQPVSSLSSGVLGPVLARPILAWPILEPGDPGATRPRRYNPRTQNILYLINNPISKQS